MKKRELRPIGTDEPSAMKNVELQRKRRVLAEARKLDPREERALAEEGMTGEKPAQPAHREGPPQHRYKP